jgi:hypothetical protein
MGYDTYTLAEKFFLPRRLGLLPGGVPIYEGGGGRTQEFYDCSRKLVIHR